MASLYEEYPGEIRVYPNRKPAINGAEPWLTWSWIQYFLAVICFSAVCFFIQFGLFKEHLLKFLFELSLLTFLVWRIVQKSVCVVFSSAKKQSWSSFLFFKWNVVPFKEISDIRLRDQEFLGNLRFQYVATRKNRFQPPIKISYPGEALDRISLFTHETVPLLQEMIPGDSAATDVAVTEVEVPVEQAQEILSSESTIKRTGNSTARRQKLHYFTANDRVYRISMKRQLYGAFAVGALVTLAVGILNTLQKVSTAAYVPWVVFGCVVTVAWIILPDLNTDFGIDINKRIFFFNTKFGRKRNEVPFEKLVTLNLKEHHGLLRLCMVLEKVEVDPNLCLTRSPEKVRDVYNEVCSILNLNPNAWFDG